MKKHGYKVWGGILFALFLSVVFMPKEVQAVEYSDGFEVDDDGFRLIHTYDELRHAALNATWEHQYRLANDIEQVDTKNNYQVDLNGNYFYLDLNGYKITRKSASTDQSLIRVMNGAVLEIRDSSETGTGGCYFVNQASNYVSVINNKGGSLLIYGGTYDILEWNNYEKSVLMLESGGTYLYGGCFGTIDTKTDYSINMVHQNFMDEVPTCFITGGEFYAHMGNIHISPMGDYAGYGCTYGTAIVLGGEFYLNYKIDGGSAGFALTNNRWGDVIVASGKIPNYWLNKGHISHDSVTFLPNVTKKGIYETTGNYKDGYIQVTAPARIVSHDLWMNERLSNEALRVCFKRYTSNLMKDSAIYKTYGEYMEAFIKDIDTIEVDAYQSVSPELWIEGLQLGDTVSWYGSYSVNGKWEPIAGHEHDKQPWRFDIRPEKATTYYVKAVIEQSNGENYEDIIKIEYEDLEKVIQGNPVINRNSVVYGNNVYADVFDAPSWQDASTYVYEWKVDGKTVGSGQSFLIDKTEYIGKKLTCTITSPKYKGSIVTPAITVGKVSNNSQPVFPNAAYDKVNDTIVLSVARSNQEYLFTSEKDPGKLTENDWFNARKPVDETAYFRLSVLDMQAYRGETIYVHTRYKETDVTKAGTKVLSVPIKLADSVYLDTIVFDDEINGIVYIPFTEKGQSVTLKYSLAPINANQWNGFSWMPTSWPVKILFPESSVTPDQNNDGRLVLSLQSVGTTTLIANYSNGTQFKKLNVVVYDPKNPSIGTANVVRPMVDQTVPMGTFFHPEMPEFVPEIPESMELYWFFTEDTQEGIKTYRKSLIGDIIPETGEIFTLGAGTVDVSLVKENTSGNGYYVLDTFKLTVVEESAYIPVEAIYLSRNNVTIQINETFNLNAKIIPSNASNIEGIWSSSDPSVVKVNQNGQFTGVKEGTAKVTLMIDSVMVSCNVTVTKDQVFDGGEEPQPSDNPFTDVKPSDYFFDPVLWAVDQGITTGTSATTFSPESPCTRAQAVTFLWRNAGRPEPKSSNNPFTDVKSGEYYYKAVLWAVENGITNGASPTLFKPDDFCTRGQIVTFLWRAAGKPAVTGTNPFNDISSNDYFCEPVLWAVSKNITNGTKPGLFEPNANCTRGQIVTFLYRSVNNE